MQAAGQKASGLVDCGIVMRTSYSTQMESVDHKLSRGSLTRRSGGAIWWRRSTRCRGARTTQEKKQPTIVKKLRCRKMMKYFSKSDVMNCPSDEFETNTLRYDVCTFEERIFRDTVGRTVARSVGSWFCTLAARADRCTVTNAKAGSWINSKRLRKAACELSKLKKTSIRVHRPPDSAERRREREDKRREQSRSEVRS